MEGRDEELTSSKYPWSPSSARKAERLAVRVRSRRRGGMSARSSFSIDIEGGLHDRSIPEKVGRRLTSFDIYNRINRYQKRRK